MSFKEKLRTIIFGTDTKGGKLFDLILLWLIVFSVLVVMVESVPQIESGHKRIFNIIEWIVTILFSFEYTLRIYCSKNRWKYVFSFWGIIDFLAVIPTYLGLIMSGYQYFQIVRILRLLRVYRILKLFKFTQESNVLYHALKSSRYKIGVFISTVIALVVLLGTLMYVVEGGTNGYTSIPQSIYWAVVTITTVGFGDIVPQTILGKIISSLIMIIGYAIIAVPTGIITVELSNATKKLETKCDHCNHTIPDYSIFCNYCGKKQ